MPPIPVADPADPRLDPYRDIRDRDLVGRQGLFIAEGKVVLRVLLQTRRFDVLSVLVSRNRLDGLGDILPMLPAGTPLYVADAATMEKVAGFDIHRGILAVGRRRAEEDPAAILARPGPALALGLAGIANHDNMGSLFRNAAAFGASGILMDATCCDPLYRKAIRVSVGAALKVPYARVPDADSLCGMFETNGYRTYALTPNGETDLADIVPAGRSALLLGAEGEGLPEAVIRRSCSVRIDIVPDFDSLNVATAAAIALHMFRIRMRDG